MEDLVLLSQLIIGFGLLNVWLLRREKATAWRGGQARTMKEEFEAYGLKSWFMNVVGFLKVSLALLMLAGIWVQPLTTLAAGGIATLMIGAAAMHLKAGDPFRRSVPALSLFVLSVFVGLS